MKHLLFLHGAVGSKSQLAPLAEALASTYAVHLFDFPGHGGGDLPNKFSIEIFASEVLKWLKENSLTKVNVFGYSMGGYVAMYLTVHHPEVVDKIATLGTKYHWSEEVAAKELKFLDAEAIEAKVPKFAIQLAQRHSPANWKDVLAKTAAMLVNIGKNPPLKEEDFEKITSEVLLLVGDKDNTASLEETAQVFRKIAKAQLAVLPNTLHPIEKVNEVHLSFLLKNFFA